MEQILKGLKAFTEDFRCPEIYAKDFEEANTELSIRIVISLIRLQIPFSLTVMVIVYLTFFANGGNLVYGILLLHLIMIGFNAVVYRILKSKSAITVKSRILSILFAFILLWTMVFTLLIYPVAGDRTVFLIGLIFFSVTSDLKPGATLVVYMIDYIVFLSALAYIGAESYTLISTAINLFALSTIIWLTSAQFYKMRLGEFLAKRRIEEQMAELSGLNEKLTALSETDALTGVHNRRSFDERLNAAWQKALANQTELTLAILDLDDFKAYNDTQGHLAGDEALIKVAHKISSACIRSDDVFARYGGEEFVLILDSDRKSALEVGERIRKAIEALAIPHPASNGGILSVSIGIKTLVPEPGVSPQDLIRSADIALYQAKGTGKNTVIAL